jgi:hypothetical protein
MSKPALIAVLTAAVVVVLISVLVLVNNQDDEPEIDSTDVAMDEPEDEGPADPLQDPEEMARRADEAAERLHQIEERGQDGWQDSATMTAAQLGQRADEELFAQGPVFVTFETMYSYPDGSHLTGEGEWKVQSPDTYRVDYYNPVGEMNRYTLVSDGENVARQVGGQWEILSGSGENELSEEEVREWPRKFGEEMMEPFLSGGEAWRPLLEAWQQGKAGYDVTVEEKQDMGLDGDRQYYRVFAETQEGDPTTIEIGFDGQNFVPVVIRVNQEKPDGTRLRLFWRGNWSYGGTFAGEEATFEIPNYAFQSAS